MKSIPHSFKTMNLTKTETKNLPRNFHMKKNENAPNTQNDNSVYLKLYLHGYPRIYKWQFYE